MKKLSLFDKVIYTINGLLASILLLSYFLRYISPKTLPVFVVLSTFIPLLIIINIIFVFYWLIKLKKQLLLSSLVLIIGFFFSTPLFKISSKTSALNNDLKVMSYNVKSFDLFIKKDSKGKELNGFEFIKVKDPDILVVQEFYKSKKVNISFPYKYIRLWPKNHKYGMAIYSKYKIINSGSFDLKNTVNNIIFADIVKDKDTIRIYGTHLESLGIRPHEENFGQKNSEKLLRRVTNSFKKQAEQTELFLAHEKEWKGKKIVCGDFNNTAYSWVYNQISRNKKDAFINAGKGFGKSFDYPFPMRIDFILTDNTATINQFKTYTEKYSDHYPIMARINW
ncbi:endonuclease/exonuclease/phosphatase family protein [Polaribacter sp. Z014]|uniref:endonuclease/exonuclease/phosphatase family protein n=1 Tax=Polaribacter sp. Z014 TaxID=2927126 RepID=UPI0020209773|nr:endonuclease/exonuclease/phosphatase family protein [Polaribacter sp. Z014]MCL7763518.1 endonuclease/exonuclease/phosphatase family protein [Polaribacter sp. Z014]